MRGFEEQKFGEIFDAANAAKAGKALGAQLVVVGSVQVAT